MDNTSAHPLRHAVMQAVHAMAERDLRLWPPAPPARSPDTSCLALPVSRDQTPAGTGGPGAALESPSSGVPDVAKSGNGHELHGEAGHHALNCGALKAAGRLADPHGSGLRVAADNTNGGGASAQQEGANVGLQHVLVKRDCAGQQGPYFTEVHGGTACGHFVKRPRLGGTSDVDSDEAGPWRVPDGAVSSYLVGDTRAGLPGMVDRGGLCDSGSNGVAHGGPSRDSEDGEHGREEQGPHVGSKSADIPGCTPGSHLPK